MQQNQILLGLVKAIGEKMVAVEPELTELDSQIGDGDCGLGIKTGFAAVVEKLPQWETENSSGILKNVGMTLVSSIGGTSGAILGTGFLRMAMTLKDCNDVGIEDCAHVLRAALRGMCERGENTQVGDKTMIDALEPAVVAFEGNTGMGCIRALEEAAAAAKKGSDSTIDLVARKGRASYLGERSRGHRDAGSMAICYMFEAARDYFKQLES